MPGLGSRQTKDQPRFTLEDISRAVNSDKAGLPMSVDDMSPKDYLRVLDLLEQANKLNFELFKTPRFCVTKRHQLRAQYQKTWAEIEAMRNRNHSFRENHT